jgi:hypothetical protein
VFIISFIRFLFFVFGGLLGYLLKSCGEEKNLCPCLESNLNFPVVAIPIEPASQERGNK